MLEETIKHLKEICRKEDLDVSPNTILKMACKIMISNNIDKSKKENIQNYQNTKIINPSIPTKSNNTITDKQKAFLIKIKKYKEGMTKQDAFKIIQELSQKKEY
jgi:hypothetical protein